MAKNVSLWGASYSNVPALDVPQTGGGTARFSDTSVTTCVDGDVTSGKIYVKADGTTSSGTLTFATYYTGSSAPSSSLGADGDIYLQTS